MAYLCDLALATGHPLAALRRWPERDVRQLIRHTAERGFPGRRIELTLARVGQVLAKALGYDFSIEHFLIEPKPITDATEPTPTTTTSPGEDGDDYSDLFGVKPTTATAPHTTH